MLGHNRGENSTADVESGCQPHEAGPCSRNQVVKDPIGHRLMKCALVAIGPDIQFQAFQLDAFPIGDVVEKKRGEVGLPRFGAKAGEFRYLHVDQEIAPGIRVGKRFQRIGGLGWHFIY